MKYIILSLTLFLSISSYSQKSWFFSINKQSFRDGENLFFTKNGQSNDVGNGMVPQLPSYITNYTYERTFVMVVGGDYELIEIGVNHNSVAVEGNYLPAYLTQHNSVLQFAYEFEQTYPNSKLYYMDVGQGATNLQIDNTLDHSPESTDEMHDRWKAYVDTSITYWSDSITIDKSLFSWHQGEADCDSIHYANNYDVNLTSKIIAVDEYYQYDLYIINELPVWLDSDYPYKNIVKTAQAYVSTRNWKYKLNKTDDYDFETDSVHISSAGQVEFGSDEFQIFINNF